MQSIPSQICKAQQVAATAECSTVRGETYRRQVLWMHDQQTSSGSFQCTVHVTSIDYWKMTMVIRCRTNAPAQSPERELMPNGDTLVPLREAGLSEQDGHVKYHLMEYSLRWWSCQHEPSRVTGMRPADIYIYSLVKKN